MPATVVVGTQWGDEGKGKLTDLLARDMDVVVRYQGGHNAGHTVVVDGVSFALQLVPSGVLYPHITPVIGNGVVVDPGVLLAELDTLGAKGIDTSRMVVSGNAHLIMPYHTELDRVTERFLGQERARHHQARHRPGLRRQGGTGGAARPGPPRRQDLPPEARGRAEGEERRPRQGLQPPPPRRRRASATSTSRSLRARASRPMVGDTVALVHDALDAGRNVLLEGAQATFLDLDHGTYPFVTSSNPVAGGACTGTGVGPRMIGEVIGIAKAYVTRVGAGPFPTECTRRGRRPARRARPRVRHQHRAAPALRLVRRRHGCARRCGSTRCRRWRSPSWTSSTPSTPSRCASAYTSGGERFAYPPYHQSVLHQVDAVYEELPGWQHRPVGRHRARRPPARGARLRRVPRRADRRAHQAGGRGPGPRAVRPVRGMTVSWSGGRMKVCVVGSGGREHALARVAGAHRRRRGHPGQPGHGAALARAADSATSLRGSSRPVTVTTGDPEDIDADLFVIGPEQPARRRAGRPLRADRRLVFGPGADGARLEGSKAFMKEVLAEAGVPTARYGVFDEAEPAAQFLRELPGPWVVKTDGLAAGKGVLVTDSLDEAEADVAAKLSGESFGDAGRRVVVEEGPRGPRVLAARARATARAWRRWPRPQDFKRIGRRRRRAQHRRDGRVLARAGRSPTVSWTASSTRRSSRSSARCAAAGSTTGACSTRGSSSPPTGPACSSTTSASATPRPRWCCPA